MKTTEQLREEALEWNQEKPDEPISHFACHYPGQYKEASDTLIEVRRET